MANTAAALMPAMICLVFIVDLLQVTLAHREVFASDTTGRGGFFPVGAKKDSSARYGASMMSNQGQGACLGIPRGRDRDRFPLRQGGADEVG